MYNPYQTPPYGQPPRGHPQYNGYPPHPSHGLPPNPGMGYSGTPAPGLPQNPYQQGPRPPFPPNFQPPPNVDFSAPTLRMGFGGPPQIPQTPTSTSARPGDFDRRDGDRDFPPRDFDRDGPRRPGLGLGGEREGLSAQRQAIRETMLMAAPPSAEEAARTVFVGDIPEEMTDRVVERLLSAIGPVRKWTRAVDADDKKCSFGFAEFEDIDSLEGAAEVLKGVKVRLPAKTGKPDGVEKAENASGDVTMNDAENGEYVEVKREEVKSEDVDEAAPSKLTIILDDLYETHLDAWRNSHPEDPSVYPERLEQTRQRMVKTLEEIRNPAAVDEDPSAEKVNGKINGMNGHSLDATAIPGEDELADIPAELREIVAAEIKSFRDRSNRRDMERLRREEEVELAERMRSTGGISRPNRLATPPTTPAIPSGPKDRSGINGAPSGPRGYVGPSDYKSGVQFVNGNSAAAAEEDTDASDSELERRRKGRHDAEEEKMFLDQERRWLNRERNRTATIEGMRERDRQIAEDLARAKEGMRRMLAEFDDEVEMRRRSEEYYRDHGAWLRNRTRFRAREAEADARDRDDEEREKAREQRQREMEELERHVVGGNVAGVGVAEQVQPTRFRMTLGAAKQGTGVSGGSASLTAAATDRQKRAALTNDVENLLETGDDEDSAATARRTLIPIAAAPSARQTRLLSPEERQAAMSTLAQEIPYDPVQLFAYPIPWQFLDGTGIIEFKLRPFLERKVLEVLGVLDDELVDSVERAVVRHQGPREIIGLLREGGMEEQDGDNVVRKLWRMIAFFGKSEERNLGVA